MFRTSIGIGISLVSAGSLLFSGCANLPGEPRSQGAVVGGVSGAAVGAAVGGEKHRVLGAILGGALGAGGGYVIGAQVDKIKNERREEAEQAATASQQSPATPQEALRSAAADVNNDGFVTLDEVVAMEQAGLSDEEMLSRMRATDQIFELTSEQKGYLTDRGVSLHVVNQMETINANRRETLTGQKRDVISRDPIRP